ncbi:MAG: hypothetical protein KDI46_07430 [Alphaproteobacteria bacterium]|nr:hypothetical protein [Alphaproteobacteria bacterium]
MRKSLKILCLASPLLLAACGEGYELVKTDAMFPYGNQRTAGSGVAYVLAQMMPEKDMNLQPVMSEREPQAIEETKAIVEEIFRDAQVK